MTPSQGKQLLVAGKHIFGRSLGSKSTFVCSVASRLDNSVILLVVSKVFTRKRVIFHQAHIFLEPCFDFSEKFLKVASYF